MLFKALLNKNSVEVKSDIITNFATGHCTFIAWNLRPGHCAQSGVAVAHIHIMFTFLYRTLDTAGVEFENQCQIKM